MREGIARAIELSPDIVLMRAVASPAELGPVPPADGPDIVLVAPDVDDTALPRVRRVAIDDRVGLPDLLAALRSPPPASPSPTSGGRSGLTRRELDVLDHLARGHSTAEVGALLGITTKSVENHKQRMFAKLGVQSTAHAVARAWAT